MLGAPSLRALLISAQKYTLQLGRAAFTRAFSASVLQKVVRRSPGTTHVRTSQANITHGECFELLQVVANQLCSSVAELLVVADAEVLE